MSEHDKLTLPKDEVTTLGGLYPKLLGGSLAATALGTVIAIGAAALAEHGWPRFFSAYLTGFAFWLSLALGALFFVLIQHVTKSGWSVTIRRFAELSAATLPVLAVLFVPVVIGLYAFDLYPWVHESEGFSAGKKVWLSPGFFVARFALYFVIWTLLAHWLWRYTTRLDEGDDQSYQSTLRVQRLSAPAVVLFAVSLAMGAFDLLMTLEPHWYSTMFGVYFFSGALVSAIAGQILMAATLQRAGRLTRAVGLDHYHDLGKLLFGFVFFWGYIAFSQYMLIWYANIPEETTFFVARGASTRSGHGNTYSYFSLLLLFGHFLIPFAGLLGRWAKRRKGLLSAWAVWVLAMHLIDLAWIVRPALTVHHQRLAFGAADLALIGGCVLAIGGIYFAAMAWFAKDRHLVPVKDPRLGDALAFEQTV